MNRIKKLLPYLMVNVICFYLLTLLMKDTGSAMFILLFAIPVITFVNAILCGRKNSLDLLYPLLVMVIFVPYVFINMNESATIYIFIYGAISLIGCFVGSRLK
ncbi:hypothetical protein [Finegoldia magna]|uniref:hypothetical protein n=1 Tax=Finegoldia magna TaxID=1260 RepID=UPI000B916263|nr:hypothetical protein [Finegoldia magna]MDU2131343.1 hypothetical protein [Finegoldia magna]MDU2219096.1 hypothetical protein [Finegoldia magna]MDU4278195.1 hypothetical protein [Finegoldia magna]MDU5071033.1 hypothetical protein [Finegoldia magna]MDU6552705.1 hypothetical protein [Finegoldia magna]